MSPIDPIWDQLGKIDYLLDQLARAVERGDAGLEVYERMAPRYLERRAELAGILERRAARGEAAPAIATITTTEPLPAERPAPALESRPVERTYLQPPVVSASVPAISAGSWMTYAGAFLVVVAVAIFTIYAWGSMPALAKLAVLGAVTAGFYLGGEFVRTRMELPAAGVALIGVGSAMLLFDGWAVINGYGLQGMWPWAVLLLACSLAYWATELRIAGGWFGAIGAAAQVGWWWLLGQAMHVPGEWQAAGIAVVALLWAVGGGRVGVDGPLVALATVLRSGSVVLGALTVVAVAAAVVGKARPDLVLVAAALVTGVCATGIVELRVRSAGRWSVLAHIPVYLAAMVCWNAGPSSSVPAVLGLLAVFYGAFAWVRGGRGYALLSTVMAATGVMALAERMEWTSFVTVGLVGALFAVGAIAGHLLEASRTRAEAPALSPERDAAVAWRAAALVGLGLSTLLGTPIAGQGLPLAAIRVGSDHALLAVWMLALWATVAAVTRARTAGWFVFGWSFYALAAGVAWAFQGLHSAWYAVALLVLAIAWRQADPIAARVLRIAADAVRVACLGLFVAIPLGAIAASTVFFSTRAYPVAFVLALAALAWAGDWLRLRLGMAWALVPAAFFGVLAAFVAGWTASDLAGGSMAAAAAGAALGLGSLAGPRRPDGWGTFLALGGAVTATVLSTWALGTPDHLAAALALITVAWGLSALAADIPELYAVAGLFGSFTLGAVLAWRDPRPWVALFSYPLLAAAFFAPEAMRTGLDGTRPRRTARALALTALAVAAQLVLMGLWARLVGDALPQLHAFEVGEVGLAVGLIAFGAIAVLRAGYDGREAETYAGYAFMLLGVFAFMDVAGIGQQELYLVAVAGYAAAMGVLYSRREVGRRFPGSADAVAFVAAVVAPFLMSIASWDPASALTHGLWALGLAVCAIVIGQLVRAKLHFVGGIIVAALEALWLSRSVLLALPSWVWIGLAGAALIGGGVTFARRQLLGEASRRVGDDMADWR